MKARTSTRDRLAVAGLVVMLSTVAGSALAGGHDFSERTEYLGRSLSFTTIENYSSGPYGACCQLLAASEERWTQEMNAMADDMVVMPAPSAPSLDWSRMAALLVAMGERSPYRSVEVTAVHRSDNRLVVDVEVSLVGNRPGMYAPYHLVAVDLGPLSRSDLEIELNYNCPTCPGVPAYTTAPTSGTEMARKDDSQKETSWGAVKGMYR